MRKRPCGKKQTMAFTTIVFNVLNQFYGVCGSWKMEDYVVLFSHASIIIMVYIFLGRFGTPTACSKCSG